MGSLDKVGGALSWAERNLVRFGIEEASREAYLFLSYLLGVGIPEVREKHGHDLTPDLRETLRVWIERRGKREPLQYIVGETEFMGLDFMVCGDVLIPRPETELLAEMALLELSGGDDKDVLTLDLCTGSGCVAVSVAARAPWVRIIATDITQAAIDTAVKNALLNDCVTRIEFFRGDLFRAIEHVGLEESFSVITANPPYIKTSEIASLMPEVGEFEPMHALDGGHDGLDVIRGIVKDAHRFLKKNAPLILEVGYDQSSEVLEILKADDNYTEVEVRKDLSDIERVIKARRK
ncbi:MAG: peptide chain release factor N(5)-glutamine methyltransferase [Deltaproteobacteria bacterium]|nr:peptide chain release factor N(5)-glutamine methyltransferase [Deltaproteobacteria bacterium]